MRDGTHANLLGALALSALVVAGPFAAPDSPVADAAMRGDVEAVRSLIREGADVNAAQGDGMTALHWTAVNGQTDIMQVLLYAGANTASTTRLGGYTPLHLASREGQSAAVRLLLERGADRDAVTTTGVQAIHLAAEAGDAAAIEALVASGADVNALESYADRTPLIFATARNRLEAMRVLIEAGADVSIPTSVKDYPALDEEDSADRRRRQRIREAQREPQPEENRRGQGGGAPGRAQQQARPGAQAGPETPDTVATADTTATPTPADTVVAAQEPPDPDRPTTPGPASRGGNQPRSLSYTDLVGRQGGMTPLHYASRDGHTEAALLLLDAGADVNQLTEGDHSTPMLVAIINGNYDLAMHFLERGADPTIASEDGATPLFAVLNAEWALRTWYPQPNAYQQQETTYLQMMEALLEAGADPNTRVNTHIWYAAYNAGRMGVDFSGATPFWRAAYATDVAAMRLLVAYGADPNISTTKPPGRIRNFPGSRRDTTEQEEEDPSGLPPVPVGGPAVHPLHAASGVGYGTSRVGQQHRHVPDGWLPAVRYLVEELGVDVNVRDHDGYSAVHHAAARGDNDVIEFLVEHGADVTFVSRRGQTTVDMANGPQQRVQPFPETIALLEGLGAKNNNNCLSCE